MRLIILSSKVKCNNIMRNNYNNVLYIMAYVQHYYVYYVLCYNYVTIIIFVMYIP